MFPLKNIVEHLLYPLIGLALITVVLFSCKDSGEAILDALPLPPPPHDTVDPFEDYTRVESVHYCFPELADFGNIDYFMVDSTLFLFTKGVLLNELKIAAVDLRGNLKLLKGYYSSAFRLDISKIVYDPERSLFYVMGEIYDETFYGVSYSNPLFLVIDLDGNLIDEQIYEWNGHHNGFEDILELPEGGFVILSNELSGSNEVYYWTNSMVFLNSSFNYVKTVPFPFDSTYINYFDLENYATLRFVGTKIDSDSYGGYFTHKFYAECDFSGSLMQLNRLGQTDEGEIYVENLDPMNIYRWNSIEWNDWRSITIEKLSEQGSLIYSRNLEIYTAAYGYFYPAIKLMKFQETNDCLYYGRFQQGGGDGPPVFIGNYIIKTDDQGNENYRIRFDEDLEGYYEYGPYLYILEDDHFLFIYNFWNNEIQENSLCISEVKIE